MPPLAGGMSGTRRPGRPHRCCPTLDQFTLAYDQLHEHIRFAVALPKGVPPFHLGTEERDWCKEARLLTNVGDTVQAKAFAESAARYYAYLRCRRFLDFSASQTEFLRNLSADRVRRQQLQELETHLVVDEVQDINPVQRDLISLLVGDHGRLTTVGDHRQLIYGFRGAKVEIIGELWNEFKSDEDAEVVDLQENFRSTPRIIDIMNVVTEPEGNACAVLLRAVEPVMNVCGRSQGPGLLCRAMDIDRHLNAHDLLSDDFYIAEPAKARPFAVVKRPRVGVEYAGHWAKRHLRFFIRGNPFVSQQ